MQQVHFQLSIEELAFAMGILGGADVSSGFLMATLGERSRQEIEGRLLAASHSLISRGYLDFDLESQTKRLDKALSNVVNVLLQNDYSIRCSRSAKGVEQVLNYFIRGRTIVEHRIVKEVVCRLELIPNTRAVVERSGDFFSITRRAKAGDRSEAVGTIPVSLLEQAKEGAFDLSREQVAALFMDAGLSADTAKKLAEDFSEPEYRGSIIRIENENGQMISNWGLLLLKGPHRFWILEIVPHDPPMVKVYPGTYQQYRDSFQMLLK